VKGIEIHHITSDQGYRDSGSTLAGQDPGADADLSGWDLAKPYFNMSMQQAYNLMRYSYNGIADRGIVW
jgi:hypothetical protein